MNFRTLAKYLDSFDKVYGIPGCDCTVYRNHVNVFRQKHGYSDEEAGKKTSYKDLYFMHSATKLINCAAIIQLEEKGLLSLDDKVTKYISDFSEDISIKNMLREYSQTLDRELHLYNHHNLSKLVKAVTGRSLDDYLLESVFMPLKMKNSSFTLNYSNIKRISVQYTMNRKTGEATESKKTLEESFAKNEGCLITTVDDYALFAETLCNNGMSKNGYRLLSEQNVKRLINDIVYNETTIENSFVCIGYNGSLVLIDLDKKITIIYAQHVKDFGSLQMEIYPKIREITYKCLGADMWSGGFNVFP